MPTSARRFRALLRSHRVEVSLKIVSPLVEETLESTDPLGRMDPLERAEDHKNSVTARTIRRPAARPAPIPSLPLMGSSMSGDATRIRKIQNGSGSNTRRHKIVRNTSAPTTRRAWGSAGMIEER